ncbi:hypothetical protein G6F57_019628 [Rhizopus arrhizus]|nr:hypothetical protein G6F57_019628 [Rhizopus arrhizus]
MAQAHARQAGIVVGVEGDGKIQFAGQQPLYEFGAVMRVDIEGDAGQRVTAVSHHARQQSQAQRGRASQAQVAVGPVAQVCGQTAHAVQVLRESRDLGRQDVGLVRGDQPALYAFEQLEAQLGLGVRQQLAGGGLRDMQRGGGLGAWLDGEEGPEPGFYVGLRGAAISGARAAAPGQRRGP